MTDFKTCFDILEYILYNKQPVNAYTEMVIACMYRNTKETFSNLIWLQKHIRDFTVT